MKIKFVSRSRLKGACGLYILKSRTIKIRKDLPMGVKIIVLMHELGHHIISCFTKCFEIQYTYDIICILLNPVYKDKKAAFKKIFKLYF
jgi:hypothetical protein